MDGDGPGILGSCQENSPGFVTETTDEESFCLFGVVLKEGGAKSEVLLEGVPIAYVRAKGGVGEVRKKVLIKDVEKVDDGTATTSEEVREDAKEAATGRVRGAVADGKENAHLEGPGIRRWWGRTGWGAESMFRVKLVVAMVMPLLKCKSKALIVEKFRIKLIFGVRRDENDLEKVSSFAVAGAYDAFGFAVGHRADLEQQQVVREALLMVCKSCCEDVFNSLFVKVIVNFCVEDLEEYEETSGSGVI